MKLALLPKKTRGGTVVAQLILHWGDEQSKTGRSAACAPRLRHADARHAAKHTREQLRDEFDRLQASVSVSGNGASIETLRRQSACGAAPDRGSPARARLSRERIRAAQARRADRRREPEERPRCARRACTCAPPHPYPPEHWLYTPTLEERMQRLESVSSTTCGAATAIFTARATRTGAGRGFRSATKCAAWRRNCSVTGQPAALRAHRRRAFETCRRSIEPRHARQGQRRVPGRAEPAAARRPARLPGAGAGQLPARRLLRFAPCAAHTRAGRPVLQHFLASAGSLDEWASSASGRSTRRRTARASKRAIREELARALKEGFTGEVEVAAASFLSAQTASTADGAHRTARRTSSPRSPPRLGCRFRRRLAALTPQQMQDGLKQYLDPLKLSIVKAGDFSRVAGKNEKLRRPDRLRPIVGST